jgi:ABC-type transport system involved in multi-copper enzyme maturation permease subunit
MSQLVRAELLKVRTTRGWWVYLIAIVLLVGLAVAGDTGSNAESRGRLDFQVGLVEAAGFAAVLSVILGITIVTTEFRHGTVTPTFLAAPSRERVLGSKSIAGSLVFLLFGLLALLVVAAVALPWLSIVGDDIHLLDGDVGTRAAQTLLSAVLWGLMGIVIGSVVHSQVAALVGTLIWIFVGETLIWGLLGLVDLDGVAGYLPFRALDAADGTSGDDLLGYWPGVAVSLGWIALLGAAGVVRTRRRDIT